MIDVVILSYAKSIEYEKITKGCIATLIGSEKDIEFNVIIVETNPEIDFHPYQTIHPQKDFNYNAFANIGIAAGKNDWVCVCNNDLGFYPQWASKLLAYGFDSMSPKCPKAKTQTKFTGVHQGYTVQEEISGWCLFFKRSVWKKIGGLDEDFKFWYADNSYAEQLKKHGIMHYLIATSNVVHFSGLTFSFLEKSTINQLTIEQEAIFIDKYGKNID